MIVTAQVNGVVMDRFVRLQAGNRLAHAYLFVGPADAGKTQTALALAQLVNCEDPTKGPCGQCGPCMKVVSGNHPDVHVLGNDDGESIKIEDIRFLLSRVQLKAYEAKTKVFIIRNVETMTLEAANALLKTLEEPSRNTLMILTTAVPEANLDTIKSRCHMVQFFPVSVNRIAQVLAQEGVDTKMAAFLAVYADGCLGKARKLAQAGIITMKNRVLDQMFSPGRIDDFLKGLAQDKPSAIQALNVLLSFLRDAVLIKSGLGQAHVIHQDRMDDLQRFAAKPMADLAGIIEQVIKSRKLIDDNLNIKMSLTLLKERMGS